MTDRPVSSNSNTSLRVWRRTLRLALLLRAGYSILGAVFSVFIPVNRHLIRSNALTETLPTPDHSLHYLLLDLWSRFDTLWYLHIGRYGYDRPDATVFYPLYPSLIKLVGTFLDPMAAALLISTIAAWLLFWGLEKLLTLDYPQDLAERTVIICAVWPASFIFFAGYPESLLLALILWSLYMARRDRWPIAAVLAVAAGLTKAAGIFLIVPLAFLVLQRRTPSSLAVLLAPAGLLGFQLWLRLHSFSSATQIYQQYWRTSAAIPSTTLWLALERLIRAPNIVLGLNVFFLLLFCVLLMLVRTRTEYVLYGAAVILFVLCKQTTPPLQSMMRYLLLVFPAFLGTAQILNRPLLKRKFAMVCIGLFVMNAALMWLFLAWSLVL
jgi:Gpi18-like mannosyltransferase